MKRLFIFLAVSCLFVCSVVGQEPLRRKKVAVVLSGGGAKGMAHIGVLNVLERAGIPVDIITGTSMGSIIGGLYSCGYRSSELDSIVRAQDWSYVLSDKDDLSHQSLEEREKQNIYAFSRSLNLRKRVSDSGGGFIMGKNINSLFSTLTAPYNDSIDFNRLPIPFACVATNIIDNTEVVFHSGVLGVAMRASMAIPGAFSPVRMGDMVLVDGGLRNNFPADIAREMGADYIIGVSVQGKPKTAEELGSAPSIIGQIVDVNCKNKYEENMSITDLPIRVNTTGYGAASFNANAIDTLIRRGEEAAMEHWDTFVALGKELSADSVPQQPVRKTASLNRRQRIGSLRFENMTSADEVYIRTKFRLHEGDSIDNTRAELITTAIRLDLFYQSAGYRIEENAVANSDGTHSARVVFTAGTKKTNQVNLGIRFDNEEMVALQANAAFPLRTKLPMEVDLTLRLGKRIMVRTDWDFHPRSFMRQKASFSFHHNDVNIYEKGRKSFNLTYNQYNLTVLPFNFNFRNFNFQIGAAWDYYHYRNLLVDRQPDHQFDRPSNQHLFSYQAQVDYNSENNWFFPTRGARLHAHFVYYTDNFVSLDDEMGTREYSASWRKTFPIGSRFSLQPMLYGRMLSGKHTPFIISNTIGGEWFGHYVEGQLPFAGVGYIEQAWDKLVAAQLQGQLHLTQNNLILLRLVAGQDADKLKDLFDHKTMIGTSLSYYYNTMFGPLGATLSYSNVTEKPVFYINLGFVF